MKVLIKNPIILFSKKIRLVKTLKKREYEEEYPEKFKWAIQMLYSEEDKWIEICRIDNFMHKGDCQSHIHLFRKRKVWKVNLTFHEAEKEIFIIGKKILREYFNEEVNFDEEKNYN